MNKYQELWNETRNNLEKNLSETTFTETFEDVKVVLKEENGIIYVLVPSTFIQSKINNLYSKRIKETLEKLTTEKVKFKFVLNDEVVTKSKPAFSPINEHNLNQNYTFESYVVGESNKVSYLTALKVAENPGSFINPLYIFGGVGLGKTHLMQAIGNYLEEANLTSEYEYKILYVQANEYLEDYAKASMAHDLSKFEEKYSNLDLLLVDDIQMLSRGTASQQEFFKLFNNMTERNKQIVITSDKPASELNGIMERLTSRFQNGMVVDIKQPDLNQRFNILKRKALESSEEQIDDDVLYYIAENFVNNVRELEGALNRVTKYSIILNRKPNIDVAKEALEILINAHSKDNNKNYEDALSVISAMYNISTTDLLGTSRQAKYVIPRHIAMYVLKTHYGLTLKRIGQIFDKDHTSIMNGCNKIENELKTNKQIQMAVDSIVKKI